MGRLRWISTEIVTMHSISIVRIIGNDLPPRHSPGQSVQNLSTILEREPDFSDTIKIWVLNRIISFDLVAILHEKITLAGHCCVVIPYRHSDYLLCPHYVPPPTTPIVFSCRKRRRLHIFSRRFRLMYITNVNPARNVAIAIGHTFARWAIPLDGNCMVATDSLAKIKDLTSSLCLRYMVLPMMRGRESLTTSFPYLLESQEPQVAFHKYAKCRFNWRYYYGRRDKAELLKRLGVTGSWASWNTDPWEPEPPVQAVLSKEVAIAGSVLRLPSGYIDGELSSVKRTCSRDEACIALLNRMDRIMVSGELSNSLSPFITE